MKRLLLFAAAVGAFAAANDIVKLDTGQVAGIAGATPEMRIYKGIPFAAPPVENLRWRVPQPAAHWDGVRQADAFGPVCMQNREAAAVRR